VIFILFALVIFDFARYVLFVNFPFCFVFSHDSLLLPHRMPSDSSSPTYSPFSPTMMPQPSPTPHKFPYSPQNPAGLSKFQPTGGAFLPTSPKVKTQMQARSFGQQQQQLQQQQQQGTVTFVNLLVKPMTSAAVSLSAPNAATHNLVYSLAAPTCAPTSTAQTVIVTKSLPSPATTTAPKVTTEVLSFSISSITLL
jgi:hypothetical protein